MKAWKIILSVLSVAVLLAPIGVAQVPGASPVAKCTKECDPIELNGGMKKGAEITKVILYGHFEDILNMAPLNTQLPDPQREPDLNRGFLMPVIDTNSNVCPAPNTCADFHFKNNEFTMFSSPGLVEYLQEGWRTHQEPGLAADAKIADTTFNLYWYMSAHNVPNQNSGSGAGSTAKVGAVPSVGVYARVETGRFKFRGDLIAESTDVPNDPAAASTRVNMMTDPRGDAVYEFIVPMSVKAPGVIPSAETKNGFIVYINPYQVKSDNTQTANQFMQADWRVRTGPNFPPRIVVPIEGVMQTKSSSLTIFEDRLFIRWSFVSVFGSYDMRDAALTLASSGAQPIDAKAIDFIILKRSVDHDGHFKPVNATWAIDYTNFPLPDGDYELTASIPNLQGTYMLEQKFPFKVVGGKPDVQQIGGGGAAGAGGAAAGAGAAKGDAAGFEGVFLVGAVLAVAIVAARRRKA